MPGPGTVTELVAGAVRGEQCAWDDLVERYLPLVASVVGRYRLGDADAQDVSQTVWLRLVEHLGEIRDPRALPGWIATTAGNEALRVLATRRRAVPVDPQVGSQLDGAPVDDDLDENLHRRELQHALRTGLAELRTAQRDLLLLLMTDPPPSYEQISARLGIPVGSIGPTRARALEQLRRTEALSGLLATRRQLEHRR